MHYSWIKMKDIVVKSVNVIVRIIKKFNIIRRLYYRTEYLKNFWKIRSFLNITNELEPIRNLFIKIYYLVEVL